MASKYKKMNLLKSLLFIVKKLKTQKKRTKKLVILSFCLYYHFFLKKPKELTNKQLSDVLPFPPKRKRRPKRLIKHQVLSNILPFYDTVGIFKREHAHRGYAETYDVEITISISLDD